MSTRWGFAVLAVAAVVTTPAAVGQTPTTPITTWAEQVVMFQESQALPEGEPPSVTGGTSPTSIGATASDTQAATTVCEAKCKAEYDSGMSSAANDLKGRKYYFAMMSANCPWLRSGENRCALEWDACTATPPFYTGRFTLALQPCCYANDVENTKQNLALCLARCPTSKDPVTATPPEQRPAAGDLGKGATLDKKAAWVSLLKFANTALEAVGPSIESLDLDNFNDLRRSLAFMQVSASLAETNGKFAVVAGGQGRLWVVKGDGTRALLDAGVSKALLGGYNPNKPGAEAEYEESRKRGEAALRALGFTGIEIGDIFNSVSMTHDFAPGQVLSFPKAGGWPPDVARRFTVSSDHGSIRGTINGGGDFI